MKIIRTRRVVLVTQTLALLGDFFRGALRRLPPAAPSFTRRLALLAPGSREELPRPALRCQSYSRMCTCVGSTLVLSRLEWSNLRYLAWRLSTIIRRPPTSWTPVLGESSGLGLVLGCALGQQLRENAVKGRWPRLCTPGLPHTSSQ